MSSQPNMLEPQLRIVGNRAYLVEERITAEMNIDDLLAKVGEARGDRTITTPPLPAADRACRVYVERGEYRGMLIQNNPCVREIEFRNRAVDKIEKYKLSFPWVWVYCVFKKVSRDVERYEWVGCYLCATYQNLVKNDLSDPCFVVPLPNQHARGRDRMCTGSSFTGMDTSMAITAQKWQTSMWESTFNADLEPSIPSSLEPAWNNLPEDVSECRDNRISAMFKQWQKMTEENPMVALSREFGLQSYETNIGGFIRRVMPN